MSLNSPVIFRYILKYEKDQAVAGLAALAQDNRLDIFRLLVRAGPEGMPAGRVAEALDLAPNTLTFHFDRLRDAGLVTVRRDGRSMIYAARFETMNGLLTFLTENCCQGAPGACAPVAACRPARGKRAKVSA
jgi:ArsR family transcriptional regulator, arsenate/arsenite/antimonite-responsive transcriptional repressor